MAERYNNGLVFQPYIAPQQNIPVEEFNNLGVVLNQRYEEGIQKYDALDAYINQIQLNDADDSIKQSVVNDTRETLKRIRESGAYERSNIPIREVAKRLANDQALTIAQQNFLRKQQQMEEEGKMRMQGINLVDFNLDRFNQSTIDPETGRARLLNYSSTERLQDYDTRRKSIYDGLQADGQEIKNSNTQMNKETGEIYQIGSGSSSRYVSADKIKAIATRNLDNYINSQEGQQELRVLTSRNSMNEEPLTEKQARQVILDRLVSTGLTRTFSQTSREQSSEYKGNLYSSGGSGNNPESPINIEGTNIITDKANIQAVNASEAISRLLGDSKGAGQVNLGNKNLGIPSLNNPSPNSTKKGSKDKTVTSEEFNTIKQMGMVLGLKPVRSTNGGLEWKNEDLKKIRDYAKQVTTAGVGVTVRTPTEETISHMQRYWSNFAPQSTDRKFYNPKTNTFYSTFDELPDKDKEALKLGKDIKVQGVIDIDNPLRDMADSSKKYKDTSGWVNPESIAVNGNTYYVTSSLGDRNKKDFQFRATQQKITRAGRTGMAIPLSNGKEKEYVVPVIGQKGLYKLVDKDNNPLFNGQAFTADKITAYAQSYNLMPE